MHRLRTALTAISAALLTSCMTVGSEFPVEPIGRIAIGETDRGDIRRLFGEPWRTGLEDGRRTWTYAHYRYSAFGPERTRDLVIRFDDVGKVASYTFNSTYKEDRFE